MSYREACEFLAKHTNLIELSNDRGARVAICPQWQGRVMTSTCGGPAGESFGFIKREFIEAGKPDPRFSNYGGEERMWLSPEGGPFSLWFKPGVEQNLANWYTAPAINAGEYEIVQQPGSPDVENPSSCTLVRRMQLQNTAGANFDLSVTREILLWDREELEDCFGPAAAELLGSRGVKTVAYETVNTVTNQGPPMDRKRGLVSIWMLSMLNAGPETVVIAPYKPGDESQLGSLQLGPVVESDYFGAVPPQRLMVTPQAVLFRADSKFRSKIGISQKRARNVIGAVDFLKGVLTLASFSMPADPTRHMYMNNAWDPNVAEPFVGDVANAYNDGPPAPGEPGFGAFYEIESLSPAKELASGESLTHRHRTIHAQADAGTLSDLARLVLGVELDAVKDKMLKAQ